MSFRDDKDPLQTNTAEEVKLSYSNRAYDSVTNRNVRAQEYYTMLLHYIDKTLDKFALEKFLQERAKEAASLDAATRKQEEDLKKFVLTATQLDTDRLKLIESLLKQLTEIQALKSKVDSMLNVVQTRLGQVNSQIQTLQMKNQTIYQQIQTILHKQYQQIPTQAVHQLNIPGTNQSIDIDLKDIFAEIRDIRLQKARNHEDDLAIETDQVVDRYIAQKSRHIVGSLIDFTKEHAEAIFSIKQQVKNANKSIESPELTSLLSEAKQNKASIQHLHEMSIQLQEAEKRLFEESKALTAKWNQIESHIHQLATNRIEVTNIPQSSQRFDPSKIDELLKQIENDLSLQMNHTKTPTHHSSYGKMMSSLKVDLSADRKSVNDKEMSATESTASPDNKALSAEVPQPKDSDEKEDEEKDDRPRLRTS